MDNPRWKKRGPRKKMTSLVAKHAAAGHHCRLEAAQGGGGVFHVLFTRQPKVGDLHLIATAQQIWPES